MTNSEYRALVVDDEAMVRQLVIRALSQYGFLCDGASNGLEAKSLISANKYDVVVSDLRMPECHGHRLAVDLLEGDDPPVLVIHTGLVEPKLARDLMARGVDDIVFKPVDHDVLAIKVMTLVDRRRATASKKNDGPIPASLPENDARKNDDQSTLACAESNVAGDDQQVSEVRQAPTLQAHSDVHPQPFTPISAAELKAKSAQVKQVLPLSQTTMDVFEMVNTGNHDAGQIADAIANDASLAVEILRYSNSSLYNRSKEKVTDLEDAVALLGQKRVGELAVATNALGALTAGALPWMDVSLAWERSLAAGMAIESLISEGGHRQLERGLMICATMHDLGRIVFGTLFPTQYASMVERCNQRNGTLLELERSIFPTSHTAFLASLLAQWNVPSDIRHPLNYLLEPSSSLNGLPDATQTKVRLIKAAVAISQVAVGRWEPWDSMEFPHESLLTTLGIRDVGAVVKRTRDRLIEVLARSKRSPGKPFNSPEASPPKVRQLAFLDLSGASFDFIRGALLSTDIELIECPMRVDDFVGSVLINRVGAPFREFATRVPAESKAKPIIVCAPADSAQSSPFGQVLCAPLSYAALRQTCRDASRALPLESNVNEQRLTEAQT